MGPGCGGVEKELRKGSGQRRPSITAVSRPHITKIEIFSETGLKSYEEYG